MPRPIPGWNPSTPDMRGQALDDLLRLHPAIVIHFWAPWNGIDPLMDLSIQGIAEEFDGRVWFGSCNVDLSENLTWCRRFGVANIPALGLSISGRPPKLLMGYRDSNRLAKEINSWLNEPDRKPWWSLWKRLHP